MGWVEERRPQGKDGGMSEWEWGSGLLRRVGLSYTQSHKITFSENLIDSESGMIEG
jgi:hypothetical protein